MPSVKIETISPTRRRLVVPVEAAEVAKAEGEVLKSVSREAVIPGFRVGKAPEAMVRSRYAKVIADELQRAVITESYQKALKDAKLDLCTVVNVEGDPIAVNRNSVVTVTVDIYPELKLPEYKGLTAKLPKVAVDEKEVTNTIDLIRGQRAQFTAVERAAAAGDYVRLSYTGSLDGKPVADLVKERPIYGTQKSTWEEAGHHEYGIKAITEGVIGMKKDDKKTVVHNFAKDFEVKELAGKAVSYELEVMEVREKKMPELNEEFFKSIGVESLEKLNEQIRKQLEGRAQEEYEMSKRTQLSDALIESVKCELPESLLQAESQNILQEMVEENQKRGVSEEELKKNEKKLIDSAKDAAQKRVKLRVILRAIAEAEKLDVVEADFQRWVMTEAMQRQVAPEKVVKDLTSDREQVSNLRQALRLGKAMQVVVDSAKIEEIAPKA